MQSSQFAIPKSVQAQKLDENSDLVRARKEITAYSLRKSGLRLFEQKKLTLEKTHAGLWDELSKEADSVTKYKLDITEMAGKSALSKGVLSPDDKYYASVSWSGKTKIWTAGRNNEMKVVTALEGHSYQAYDLDWHPDYPNCDGEGINMATCGADCTIRLWTFDLEEKKQNHLEIKGHNERVNRVKFHPMGLHLLSCSYDKNIAFWDLETEKVLTRMKGHTASIYTMSLHPDGSLVVSSKFYSQSDF